MNAKRDKKRFILLIIIMLIIILTVINVNAANEKGKVKSSILAQVAKPSFTASGTVTWVNVPNAKKYQVQLYQNGISQGSPKILTSGKIGLNFFQLMRSLGPGSYTVKVKALGDGKLFKDGLQSNPSDAQVIRDPKTIPLSKVEQPKLSEFGVATWLDVPNAKNYEVQLFKNGIAWGAPRNAQTGNKGYNFLSMMRATGEGEYTVKITAKGDGLLYTDGIISIESAVQRISKAETVTEIKLSPSGIATWTNTNGTSYELRLYKNGVLVNKQIGVSSGYIYLNTMRNNGAGMYAITVTAKSNAGLIIDGDESIPSGTQPISVPLKQVESPKWQLEQPVWGPHIITWTPVTDAANYEVKLYKNESRISTQNISPETTSFDFSTIIAQNSPGTFTVTVQAKGSGVNSDGPISEPSSKQDDLMLASGFNITNVTYDDGCSGYKLQIDRSKLPPRAADFVYMAWFLPNELNENDFQRFLKDLISSNSMVFLLQKDEFCWKDYTQYDVFMLLDKDLNLLGYYIYDK